MDATRRWETEALRTSSSRRPKPSNSRRGGTSPKTWVTLKEAEAETGIPTNTLRKWVRKDAIPSFLEHDGDFALRMVDLEAVRTRAKELGRRVEPASRAQTPDTRHQTPDTQPDDGQGMSDVGDSHQDNGELLVELKEEARSSEPERAGSVAPEPGEATGDLTDEDPGSATIPEPRPEVPDSQFPEDPPAPELPPDTMLVPVDAWNKMLTQLGNLHEAGQQLADARERAAKAETEAEFLRERLSELRSEPQAPSLKPQASTPEELPDSQTSELPNSPEPEAQETTTYWRYLTTGWRDRKRRTR